VTVRQIYEGKGTEPIATVANVHARLSDNSAIELELDGHRSTAAVVDDDEEVHVFGPGGIRISFGNVLPSYLQQSGAGEAGSVYTPMPCKIAQVLVKPGQTVTADQPLIVLEAMKMEVGRPAGSATCLMAHRD